MAFEDSIKKQRAETEARGYRVSDMNKIEERIKRDRRDWTRRFQEFVESMLYHADTMSPKEIIRYARELADAEYEAVKEKFREEPELEE